MNHHLTHIPLAGLAAILMLVLTGCNKPADQDADDGQDHAGHAHDHQPQAASDHPPGTAQGVTCAAHQVPVERCFLCDPALRDEGRLWCMEHDRYEDRCWLCHPELRNEGRAYCDEHGLYEDECFYCNPSLAASMDGRASANGDAADLFCTEHGVLEFECGICRPELAGRLNTGESLKVRMPSVNSARAAGVQTGRASVGSISDGIESYAELAFDQNKLAQIVAPVRGVVEEVTTDLGSRIDENQTVARLWSAEIAEAVAGAVLSHQTLDRERKLREQRVTSEQDLQEAQATHRAACQQLRTYGFTEEQIDELRHNPEESVLLEVRAPFAGEIVERVAVRGELVDAGRHLFTLADRSVMWAMLNIPEVHLARVQSGQTVELQFDSIPGKTFTGALTWISAEVDERSRMVRARAEVPNPEGILRARMFARARILTRNPDGALLLPDSAVQQVEGKPLVFVKLEEDLFEARRIALGARLDGRVEVLAGLRADEVVAVNHVFPLKSQLLISRLGAGCAHE